MKPDSSSTEGEKHKQLDRDVREMVSGLTHRLGDLHQVHKLGSTHGHMHEGEDDHDHDHGVRVITLAGNNTGATLLRSELDDKSTPDHGLSLGDQDALSTYVNSNFQAINNSIMLGGSYCTNDPGVHLEVSDFFEHHHGHIPDKHGKKGKKKDKEPQHSD